METASSFAYRGRRKVSSNKNPGALSFSNWGNMVPKAVALVARARLARRSPCKNPAGGSVMWMLGLLSGKPFADPKEARDVRGGLLEGGCSLRLSDSPDTIPIS